MPSIPFFVLLPQASAVPAAAESVTGDEAEYVYASDVTGNDVITKGRALFCTIRTYVCVADT